MHDEFEMSMMEELNFFLGLQIKQIEDEIFFNQSKYIKEMLKKFRLEDSKPTKTPMWIEIKLTKDDEATPWIALNIKDRIMLNLSKISQNGTISTQDQKSEEKSDQKAVFSRISLH
nr:retrovirus-related Pol polyprotein from transposon TNT 1-94 [Tanacetum cinerariifolium]